MCHWYFPQTALFTLYHAAKHTTNKHVLCWQARTVQLVTTSLWTGNMSNYASTTDKVKWFIFPPKCPHRLWGHPAPCSIGTGVSCSGGQPAKCDADNSPPHPVTSWRISGAIPPLFHIHSLCAQEQPTYTNTSLLMTCEAPTPIISFYYLHAVYIAQTLYNVFQE